MMMMKRVFLTLLLLATATAPVVFSQSGILNSRAQTVRNIPATVQVWARYKASSTSHADGALVSEWNDISGNGRNATQSDGLAQPTKRIGVAGLSGNTTAFEFSPSLGQPKFFDLPSMAALTQGEVFIYLKAFTDGGSLSGSLWLLGSAGSLYPDSSGVIQDGFGSDSVKTVGNVAEDLTGWHLYNVISKDTFWAARVDTFTKFMTPANTVLFPAAPKIGTDDGFNIFGGYVAEILILSREATFEERSGIEAYFNNEY